MRPAFYISDGTAITSEVFGHALLSLFPMEFEHHTISFVETVAKAEEAKAKINAISKRSGEKPLVFHTFVNPEIRAIIDSCDAIIYNFLEHFVSPLEKELNVQAKPKAHRTHSIHENSYDYRIDAVNYALANDDGSNVTNYADADIILVGVSRSGKTPTSLYLALQYGIKAANYPFTDDDMDELKLPNFLKQHKKKIFGLTIDPERLMDIRDNRRANSKYSSARQCRMELREVEKLYKKEKIPFINSTKFSVEEITAKILAETGLRRHKY
ncbi:posphoenolpyruvate synthetase regulatory kinase/phosphorylase PpsR [Thalassotalea euphylliae]|uniref:Putative phosphoenolpyruvate synthase regulatory protein n=1 Tax=Thalassotalea euphylliae TaxID=1655234 RepID=A0A3E0TYK6_9GAMM|nr:pyruvate, water dikinase regulatory protein [Thalassotalea euphylliae]REL29487.1 kinase/pyrophosphorylase [Thalassotalea euphylliae]REL35515.1 kinase/pyrophosphorylase [Thalassotalea euphylliae]